MFSRTTFIALILALFAPPQSHALYCREIFYDYSKLIERDGELVPAWVLTPSQKKSGHDLIRGKSQKLTKPKVVEVPVNIAFLKSGIHILAEDKHHSVAAVVEKYGTNVNVRIRILQVEHHPYMSDQAYALKLIKERKMLADPKDITKQWTFKDNWPRHIWNLEDNPMRSMVKYIFKKHGLSGNDFISYIQFYVGQIMLESGYRLPKKAQFSESSINSAALFLFTNKKAVQTLIEGIFHGGSEGKRIYTRIQEIEQSYLLQSK